MSLSPFVPIRPTVQRHTLAQQPGAAPTACLRYAQAKQAALASGANLLLSYSAAKGAVVGDLLHQALAGNVM